MLKKLQLKFISINISNSSTNSFSSSFNQYNTPILSDKLSLFSSLLN